MNANFENAPNKNTLIRVNPDTLALVTTHQCTAQCKNCCFSCSPQKSQRLTTIEMKDYIVQAKSTFPDSLHTLVLTGGECTLLGDDLFSMIEFGHEQKLRTRIVTNGCWATSPERAKDFVQKLQYSHLDEINFSTGDDHKQWVPISRIYNGVRASMDAGIITAIFIEERDKRTFDTMSFLSDGNLKEYTDGTKYKHPLLVENGLWVPFDKTEVISYDRLCIGNKQGCTSIFTTIAINPYSQMMSCCGLTSEYLKPMRLGSLKEKSIRELYQSQFSDLLKIWIHIDGPHKILEYIRRGLNEDTPVIGHDCYVCAEIMKNQTYVDFLQNHIDEIQKLVLFKYQLLHQNSNS